MLFKAESVIVHHNCDGSVNLVADFNSGQRKDIFDLVVDVDGLSVLLSDYEVDFLQEVVGRVRDIQLGAKLLGSSDRE